MFAFLRLAVGTVICDYIIPRRPHQNEKQIK